MRLFSPKNISKILINIQVLKLSGIGPTEELERNGIPVALDLPAVGANLVDHPVIHLNYKELKDTSLKYLNPKNFSEATKAIFATVRYFLGFGGPLATNVKSQLFYLGIFG